MCQKGKKILVLHIITSLSTGGAEMMLHKLLSSINREKFKPVVISLTDKGTLGNKIEALDIPVITLGINSGTSLLLATSKLIHIINQVKPGLIQGWMYHGNLAASLASISSFRIIPMVWNIRQSVYFLKYEKRSTAIAIRVLSYLSQSPKIIIYNARISAYQHEKLGYCQSKSLLIPNGFDTNVFQTSKEAHQGLRQELNLEKDTFIMGLVARFHPMKDHNNFLQAAAILLKNNPDIHFVLAGRNVDSNNRELVKLIHSLDIQEETHLLGERQDMADITAAFNLATCSSYTEAFPNVVGEAMSCGVPCVVTDVGDSAFIVGDTGRVVPPQNPEALAKAWQELIDLGIEERKALGLAARTRIVNNFSLESVVAQYENLYQNIVGQKSKLKGI